MKIMIKSPENREDFKAYYDLRYRVLREPWGQPRGSEKDDYEPLSEHFIAVDEETGAIVGAVKWFEKEPGVAWFSHLAVDPHYQRKGIGKSLVEMVERSVREKGYRVLGCMSRLNTIAYLEKLGYRVAGLPAHYFGPIQVIWMQKELN